MPPCGRLIASSTLHLTLPRISLLFSGTNIVQSFSYHIIGVTLQPLPYYLFYFASKPSQNPPLAPPPTSQNPLPTLLRNKHNSKPYSFNYHIMMMIAVTHMMTMIVEMVINFMTMTKILMMTISIHLIASTHHSIRVTCFIP